MSLFTQSNYFLGLASIAVVLLWGVSLWNGTVTALVVASWTGQFENGTRFETRYTGLFVLDFPISLLVAFFFYGTNGSHPGYQLFLVDAYSTLQSAFVWLYAESYRNHSKPYTVANPIIWGLMWQAFGAAIALPLFFQQHLKWSNNIHMPLPPADLCAARALPISFMLGALLPAVVGMLTIWYPRSDQLHQQILAAWQLDPVWVSLFQWALVAAFSSYSTKQSDEKSVHWLQFSYAFAAASSAAGHLYSVTALLLSPDPRSTFERVYVPFLFSGPEDATLKLANGPWLFLQYDLIIISVSCLSWAYVLADRIIEGQTRIRESVHLLILTGGIILGPGAVVSIVLFCREENLQRKRRVICTPSAKAR
ncbi:hypothetical protein T440DRAFT_406554 [Plenodomus tracheiphilus IPT5]|uniref:Uncharacterized protein n=1 Tax=Plenodomus tracheiphilus IPT5 TaxID=1408161 RepID=A0A6A7ARY5_9PLEO|nr:hypothetical protein T440DRAFT_406554 [Plenodomus tracheiphilus IPT5]